MSRAIKGVILLNLSAISDFYELKYKKEKKEKDVTLNTKCAESNLCSNGHDNLFFSNVPSESLLQLFFLGFI